MEETRMRASTLLYKVFLQHLSPLLCLSTFTALWLTILDFMEKYMKADSSDLLVSLHCFHPGFLFKKLQEEAEFVALMLIF